MRRVRPSLYCLCLNHHPATAPPHGRTQIQNGHCGPWRPGRDGEVAASPIFMKGCVDLGVVTFRTDLLEETGFRFAVDRLRSIPAGSAPPKEMFMGASPRGARHGRDARTARAGGCKRSAVEVYTSLH